VAAALLAATLASCDLPEGFHEYTVFEGLTEPTNVEFAPDGRVFVTEKRGVVKVFDGLDDPSATVFADLRTRVFNGWDRGMLGLAIAPDYTTDPAVYVSYTLDQKPGGTVPTWGQPFGNVDNCPTPPGYTDDGCVVMGRLSKLPLDPDGSWSGRETVLIDDWCQQYPSHSIGTIAFGPDGSLYAGGGEGANFATLDYGQAGNPLNPCGDPPVGVGGTQQATTSQGGSLRAQDVRTPGDPTGLGGTVVRVDPDTGAGLPGNPLASSPDANARRIVAHGLRNPFRFTLRPGTSELWIGDVGWDDWEEVNRSVGNDAVLDNFGWPCYEGTPRHRRWDLTDNAMCEALYAQAGAAKPPYYAYVHYQKITPNERCDERAGAVITGLAFQPVSSPYPSSYDGALYFADAYRRCIWRLDTGTNGLPDPTKVRLFHSHTGTAVDLQFGPGGELWYVDLEGGTVNRVGYSASNHPPVPVLQAAPTSGDPPLDVTFDASASTDQDPGDEVVFTWDVDGDGAFDDGMGPVLTQRFATDGIKIVRVKATDKAGAFATASRSVTVGAPTAPVPVIDAPPDGFQATVGSTVAFSGAATGPDGNPLPPSALRWQADLQHCPDLCHRHPAIFSLDEAASGSFVVPDHSYPTAIDLVLTATAGDESVSVTRRIDYRATAVTAASQPAGAPLAVGAATGIAPFTSSQSTGGRATLSAPATATIGGVSHEFVRWQHGGAATHDVTVPDTPTTYTAVYQPT
jgi:glucose/arabinose dehydrogenase